MTETKRPLNLAHRGARRFAPENTLAAFLAAQALGADGIELDIFQCQSGELVVTHDEDLTLWSNGQGQVRESPLAALKELDFGGHFSPQFAGEQIPTLQEVIDTLSSKMFINIEVKTLALRPLAEVTALAKLISNNSLYHRVLVSSFNPMVLFYLKRIDAHIPTGLLFASRLPLYANGPKKLNLLKLEALHPELKLTTPRFVAKAQKYGYKVNSWTVNEIEDMTRLIALGVDSIITDYPDRLSQLLAQTTLTY